MESIAPHMNVPEGERLLVSVLLVHSLVLVSNSTRPGVGTKDVRFRVAGLECELE